MCLGWGGGQIGGWMGGGRDGWMDVQRYWTLKLAVLPDDSSILITNIIDPNQKYLSECLLRLTVILFTSQT